MSTDSFPRHYYLGEHLLVLPPTNEIAFLKNRQLLHRQKLEPRAMQVLQVLMAGDGQVVTKEELVEQVWGDYGGGEDGLMQAISKLRRALRDRARSPRVIETIPKRGYRLLLPVRATHSQDFTPAGGRPIPSDPAVLQPTAGLVQPIGWLTGFIERLTQPRFLMAFLLFSVVVIMVLGILSYMLFWAGVAMDLI